MRASRRRIAISVRGITEVRKDGDNCARLPDFIGVGPPRTGTTWLNSVLYHRACLPKYIKETHFFDDFYEKGLDWYSSHFQWGTEFALAGEVTPTYFSLPEVRERIARDLPERRIICTFRDPVERAYSAYRLLVREGRTSLGFKEEVMQPGSWIRETNRYAFHLRGWQRLFGVSNVGTFFYADLKADEQSYVDSVCDFLGVPSVDLSEIGPSLIRNSARRRPWSHGVAAKARRLRIWLNAHRADYLTRALARSGLWNLLREGKREFPPLDPQIETRMRALFLPEVDALEELTGRELSAWKKNCGNVVAGSGMASAKAGSQSV